MCVFVVHQKISVGDMVFSAFLCLSQQSFGLFGSNDRDHRVIPYSLIVVEIVRRQPSLRNVVTGFEIRDDNVTCNFFLPKHTIIK